MATVKQPLPEVVSSEQWKAALDQLLVKEKELTRARDALNAERRKLPMVKVAKHYTLQGENGAVSLLDLFEGRRELSSNLVFRDLIKQHPDCLYPPRFRL
jgi:predicted dithiol-disulfide oxidoreductase (DUF899 family)